MGNSAEKSVFEGVEFGYFLYLVLGSFIDLVGWGRSQNSPPMMPLSY